ncbi:hypothetical protein [Streptomyces sp. AGS-58]|uniref:hypothetical protein n=2 Tax=unclassified Streptomyces TaxID=2593676 RepID=UPI0035A26DA7
MGIRRTDMFAIYDGHEAARFEGKWIAFDPSAGASGDVAKSGAGSTTAMTLTGAPALWVKCIDGWEENGDWAGYLQVACEHEKGKWIDSDDGWVKTVTSRDKCEPVWFVDKGDHYELWQGRTRRRPLTREKNYLRFNLGATPGRFVLRDLVDRGHR